MQTRKRSQRGGVRSKPVSRKARKSLLSPTAHFFTSVRSGAKTLKRGRTQGDALQSYVLSMMHERGELQERLNVLKHMAKMLKSPHLSSATEDDITMYLSMVDASIRDVVEENEHIIAVHFNFDTYEPLLRRPKQKLSDFERSVRFLERLLKKAHKAKGEDLRELDGLAAEFTKGIEQTMKTHKDILSRVAERAMKTEEEDEFSDLFKKMRM